MSNIAQLPDAITYDVFGGDMEDHSTVDSSTDRNADQINALFCAASMMSRTTPKAWVRFIANNPPVLLEWEALWKEKSNVAPQLTRSLAGRYTITFPSSVQDARGDSHSLNFKGCTVQNETDSIKLSAKKVSGTAVEIIGYIADAYSDIPGTYIFVVIY